MVGQVKAGKSSLLNLLLFGGKEVLPKAATPMTASLTHITKSDRDEIRVKYYTKKDWAAIEEHAKEYKRKKEQGESIPAFVQASHELVEMAAARGLQVGQYLGDTFVEAVPVSEMNDKLKSLVGADGRLTPLVKSVAIRCAQGFPDLNIVDTPGINDPISSRSRRANKMLVECDAVLLLSYAGQFMDNVDVTFFKKKLPQEGINNVLIIGSKFDSALIDVAPDAQGKLDDARNNTERRLKSHASEAIQRLTKDHAQSTTDPKIIFTSAMCSKLAATPYDQWDHQEEKSTFDRLRSAYPDWLDPADESAAVITKNTKETLTALGNQQQLEDHLDELRRNKEQHIFASNRQTVEAKYAAARKEVDELLNSLHTCRDKINSVKVEQVDQQMKMLIGLESRLRAMIGDEWHLCMNREMKPLTEFLDKLRTGAKAAREDVRRAVSTRTKTRRVEKEGVWNWCKQLVGAESGWRTESYEEQVLNTNAVKNAIQEVREHITDELDEFRGQLFTDSNFVPKSQEALIRIVANELSNEVATDYDVDMLRASLRNAIATVAASVRDKLGKGVNVQTRELSLRSKDVERGLDQARKAIQSAMTKARRWVKRARCEWSQIARASEDDLVPLAVAGLKNSQEQLKKDIEDRVFMTSRIDSALREIEQCKATLSGLG